MPDTPAPADNWFQRMRRGDVPPPNVARLLGAHIVRVDTEAGELEVHYQGSEDFTNPAGGIQGGMQGAMLDDLLASLVDATLGAGEVVATLSMNLAFQRAAHPGPLQGHARLQRRGREVVHVAGELRQDGRIVATATAVCIVLRRPT